MNAPDLLQSILYVIRGASECGELGLSVWDEKGRLIANAPSASLPPSFDPNDAIPLLSPEQIRIGYVRIVTERCLPRSTVEALVALAALLAGRHRLEAGSAALAVLCREYRHREDIIDKMLSDMQLVHGMEEWINGVLVRCTSSLDLEGNPCRSVVVNFSDHEQPELLGSRHIRDNDCSAVIEAFRKAHAFRQFRDYWGAMAETNLPAVFDLHPDVCLPYLRPIAEVQLGRWVQMRHRRDAAGTLTVLLAVFRNVAFSDVELERSGLVMAAGLAVLQGAVLPARLRLQHSRFVERSLRAAIQTIAHETRNAANGAGLWLHNGATELGQSDNQALRKAEAALQGIGASAGAVLDAFANYPPGRQFVRLQEVAEHAKGIVEQYRQTRDVTIELTLPGEFEVECEPHLVIPALAHLLRNAVDAAARGGRHVAVSATSDASGAALLLALQDDGPGFDDTAMSSLTGDHVPQRDPERSYARSGFGLAFCRQVFNDQHWLVSVGTGSLGGAQITLTIPLKGADRHVSRSQPEQK